MTGATPTLSSCVADSNTRLDSAGGGFFLSAAGCYEGLHAYDRGQTPGSPQLRGIVFGSSIGNSYVTGHTNVPSGTLQVSGTTPTSGSYVRIVRQGTTLYTVG